MTLPRLTFPTTVVLHAVATGHVYGFDIIGATGFGSGTVYPILRRLEAAGLLRGAHERPTTAQQAGRPPRRYYTITRSGAEALQGALARHPAAPAVFAPLNRQPRPGLA